ncbi:alanine racemase [Paenibacillus sp. HB172176]|uniref:alanine racemase n=1 Tax=Paenibacillus sp. HB172176 TaxID=2493690 RepID=UPI0014388CE8|nr:alanine racemase [Paenibacillus sp. HB172176]
MTMYGSGTLSSQVEKLHRPTWTEISPKAVRSNIRAFRQQMQPNCRFMAVVKADGYGHGIETIAEAAIEGGADRLGVAILDEALLLRKAGVQAGIQVLGYTPPQAVEAAVRKGITLTVCHADVIEAVVEAAERSGKVARIHLKLDSGMTRLGVSTSAEAFRLLEKTRGSSKVMVEGIFTHLASADHADGSLAERQFGRFMEMVRQLEELAGPIAEKHCCNTAAALRYPHMHLDMVRVGLGLYGMVTSEHVPPPSKPLEPVMQLRSKIVLLHDVEPGARVSYGGSFRADRPSRIAVVPIGYADGMPRSLSNIGYAIVRGRLAKIAGRICMDQLMLDVTEALDAQEGDIVTFIGESDGLSISAEQVARWSDSITHEIVSRISPRVSRLAVDSKMT